MISFQTEPQAYRHWRLTLTPPLARLALKVNPEAGLRPDYALKLNSYDLSVDIELYDAVLRLRLEHPSVKVVIITSDDEKVFCAGANIRMLAGADHAHKVNFCKFTNETRLAIEDASAHSGQLYLCVINGPAAGGGYELALACAHIILQDDGATSVALPEVPLLGVLPATGGLTRLVDKRRVRRDLADVFCTLEEGVRGARAVEWRLVDEIAARSRLAEQVDKRAAAMAALSDRPDEAEKVNALPSLAVDFTANPIAFDDLKLDIDRQAGTATFTLQVPQSPPPDDAAAATAEAASFWPLRLVRALDLAILHLRLNETELGTWIFTSEGALDTVAAYDRFLQRYQEDWFVREVLLYWRCVLKRLDVSARSVFTFLTPGSCFCGFLAELVFAADRSYMLLGSLEGDNRPPARLQLSALNFGAFSMVNGLNRLQQRFLQDEVALNAAKENLEKPLLAEQAEALGLVTFAPDDIDWEDEIRLVVEERAAFSPDALTGLEANLRFAGPETMESKIFARLSAWQNWIFQRPNAAGEDGALKTYGSGRRSQFDKNRV